jgi:hypothetical protein
MSLLSRLVDERFLEHRRRSTSTAGIAMGVLAILLFAYHFYVQHRWSWDLFAIFMGFIVIKMSLMLWYSLTD